MPLKQMRAAWLSCPYWYPARWGRQLWHSWPADHRLIVDIKAMLEQVVLVSKIMNYSWWDSKKWLPCLITSCFPPSQELYHLCASCTQTHTHTHEYTHSLFLLNSPCGLQFPQPHFELLVFGSAPGWVNVTAMWKASAKVSPLARIWSSV